MGKIDIALKDLAKRDLAPLLHWLLPGTSGFELVEMPQELPATLRHVDMLVKAIEAAQGGRELIVIESQVEKDLELLKTMLLRTALVHHHYELPVRSLLLALTPRAVVAERYHYGWRRGRKLCHGIEVRRIYREDGTAVLQSGPQVALPLVPLMRGAAPDELFEETMMRIAQLPCGREHKRLVVAWAATFATLRLKRERIDAIVKSVTRRRNWVWLLSDDAISDEAASVHEPQVAAV